MVTLDTPVVMNIAIWLLFFRWSSAFHHVLVFTVKKRCVLFIDFVDNTLWIGTFLCENIYSMNAKNYRAQFWSCSQNMLCLDVYIE